MTDTFYRPPQADLLAPFSQDLSLAERSTRLAATLLDNVVVFAVFASIAIPLASGGKPSEIGILICALLLLAVLAINLFMMARSGQTIGKRLMKIRVVRSDGSRVSLGRYLGLRVIPLQLVAQIPLVGPFVVFADMLSIFRDSRKCLHDDVADTIVVTA
ncbi:MAG TPA: RDD family protein [Myxococcota bacterium]|nr:RDD family protein [Myxococcota bacterium]